MITLPEWIKVGALVKGIGFVGRIEDILSSDSGRIVIKVSSPKAARLWQSPDLLDYTNAPDMWQPATRDDLRQEANMEIERSKQACAAVELYLLKVEKVNVG